MKHYDGTYFEWQRKVGAFGGKANVFKFQKFISPTDKVVDFGCGGAFLLSNIKCGEKLGVEINPSARELAKENGVNVVNSVDKIEDGWADVIISNSALEHTHRPLDEVISLLPKVKRGGKVIFIVPHELNWKYKPNDKNQHLYCWSLMSIGNLFTTAGFHVKKVEPIRHIWPPKYMFIRKYFGETIFNILSRIYGSLPWTLFYHLRVEAYRE